MFLFLSEFSSQRVSEPKNANCLNLFNAKSNFNARIFNDKNSSNNINGNLRVRILFNCVSQLDFSIKLYSCKNCGCYYM